MSNSLTRTKINSSLLLLDPKQEVHDDEIEFEDENFSLDSKIPELKASLIPKEDYDSDPGGLDPDFLEDASVARVKEEDDDDQNINGEKQNF